MSMNDNSDEDIQKKQKFLLVFRILYLILVIAQVTICVTSSEKTSSIVNFFYAFFYFSLPLILLLFNINYKKEDYKYSNIITISAIIMLCISIVYFLDPLALAVLYNFYFVFVLFVLIYIGKKILSSTE